MTESALALRTRLLILLGPLAGLFVGALWFGLMMRLGVVSAALERLGGPLLGKLFSSSDNLGLLGGLIGLAGATLMVADLIKPSNSASEE
jgi:hypothetical protein